MSSRKYLKRAAGFSHLDKNISFTPYFVQNNMIDVEGTCNEDAFDNLNELKAKSGWNDIQMNGFIEKMRKFVEI